MTESLIQPSGKQKVVERVGRLVEALGFEVADSDFTKPWGAFYRLKDNEAEKFINTYFADIKQEFTTFDNLSPKYLMVAPGLNLSWQYHNRRSEIWRVLESAVGVKLSDDDNLPKDTILYQKNDIVRFGVGKRHRLIGAGSWGIVAEIWQHTYPNKPSDESDIVRVQDDFGR